MLELARSSYDFNLEYARKLVADVPEDQMCAQPVPGRMMNHAAFLIGHLAWTSDSGVRFLGIEPTGAAAWKDLCGMGATPSDERSRYPSKAELLQALEAAHGRLAAAVAVATPEMLAQPTPERMRNRWPTVGHAMLGLMTAHEAMHLGQLSAWRRALGYPAVF